MKSEYMMELLVAGIMMVGVFVFWVGHYCGWMARARFEDEIREKEKRLAALEARVRELKK